MQYSALIVDDEPSLLETMRLILEHSGYAVRTAATVDESLCLIQEQRFDVLLGDLSMPGDGATVVAAMRRAQPRTVIIVITGHVMPEAVPRDVRRLADEILTKPTDVPELLAVLARRLGG